MGDFPSSVFERRSRRLCSPLSRLPASLYVLMSALNCTFGAARKEIIQLFRRNHEYSHCDSSIESADLVGLVKSRPVWTVNRYRAEIATLIFLRAAVERTKGGRKVVGRAGLSSRSWTVNNERERESLSRCNRRFEERTKRPHFLSIASICSSTGEDLKRARSIRAHMYIHIHV